MARQLTRRAIAIFVTLIGTVSICAVAAPPTTGPMTWDLPGLSGTAAQIKAQLHQELDTLNTKIAEAQGEVRSAQTEMQKHHDAVVAQLPQQNDPTYQYVCKTIADSQAELATTTSKSRADELRLKIEGFTKRRAAIEDQAVARDAGTQKFQADITTKQATVDRLKADLAKAIDWRCQIGEAVRGGLALTFPPLPDTTGIIGQIRIVDIDHVGVVTARGSIFKPIRQEPGQKEGIITVSGSDVPAEFLISGWTDDSVAVGQDVFFDKIVRVVSSHRGEDAMIIRVERFPSEQDAILADFHEFRKAGDDGVAAR
jgi:hypothetical protein